MPLKKTDFVREPMNNSNQLAQTQELLSQIQQLTAVNDELRNYANSSKENEQRANKLANENKELNQRLIASNASIERSTASNQKLRDEVTALRDELREVKASKVEIRTETRTELQSKCKSCNATWVRSMKPYLYISTFYAILVTVLTGARNEVVFVDFRDFWSLAWQFIKNTSLNAYGLFKGLGTVAAIVISIIVVLFILVLLYGLTVGTIEGAVKHHVFDMATAVYSLSMLALFVFFGPLVKPILKINIFSLLLILLTAWLIGRAFGEDLRMIVGFFMFAFAVLYGLNLYLHYYPVKALNINSEQVQSESEYIENESEVETYGETETDTDQ